MGRRELQKQVSAAVGLYERAIEVRYILTRSQGGFDSLQLAPALVCKGAKAEV